MADRRKPDTEDSALWKSVTKDVAPLKRKSPTHPVPTAESPAQDTAAAKKKRPAVRPAAPSRPAVPPALQPEPLSHGRASGVDRRTMDRLRRGQLAVEAEIDLHGHTRDAAHSALTAFVAGHASAGRRCVRVVTGKGMFREGGGVLRAEVPRWLNESPLREVVLAFAHARRDDGGEGALYVLLRRRRPDRGPAR